MRPDSLRPSIPLPLAVLGTVLVALRCLAACHADEPTARRTTATRGDGEGAQCTDLGASYAGFDGAKLEATREQAPAGADRARVKPYSALRAEYEHALGVAPKGLPDVAAAFGAPGERFWSEPRANAILVYATFKVAFEGCLDYVAGFSELGEAPTEESAPRECAAMARHFWSRAPTSKEVDACAKVALVDSAEDDEPERRWAYTCAALLGSAGFLTY